ncbi:MAG: 50S ribosomal protein L18 [Candidatus Buchananbacteria bacterium]
MNKVKVNNLRVERRAKRVRAKVSGTAVCPRLSVYRSLSHIQAQLIDDVSGKTLVAATDREIKAKAGKTDKAQAVGKLLAEKAKTLGIATAVFDRGRFKYHGRVKALAEGAREGGLKI